MARSTRISALALILLATGLQAQDVRITIEGSITSAEVLGAVVKGSMQLTIVNATETQLRNVTLRLARPASGSLGEGSVDIGTIDVDETAAPIVPFQIESEFLNGDEPPIITLTYDDSGGERRAANIAVRRSSDGGGL
jgi:hypothetical protein